MRNKRHICNRAARGAVVRFALAGLLSIAPQAQAADPLSTLDQVAPSQAGSKHLPVLTEPCQQEVAGKAVALTLAQVVERALCANPQTREAWANARYQAAQVGVGESAYLPSLNLSGAASHNHSSGTSYNQQSATLALSYLLYDFGGRDAARESARQILAAANASQDASIQSVFLAAVQAYYRFFAAQSAVESAREAEKSAQVSLNAAAARYKAGVATPADKLQAQTAYSQAVLNRIQAEGNARNAQGVLANSMGMDANLAFNVAPPMVTAPDVRFEQDVAKLIEAARQQRPELAAAEAQVKAAKASVAAAKAAGMPSISLAANASRSHSSLLNDTSNSAALGVSITFPLFTGYNNTYRIRAAEEQVETRLAQQEKLRQQVALEVWQAYQGVVTGTQAVSSSADLLASATRSERVAAGRYKAGVGTILELLTAQSALANARLQNIQALFNWQLAKAGLAQAIGKLDLAAIATAATDKNSP